jgi:hypothetical protein
MVFGGDPHTTSRTCSIDAFTKSRTPSASNMENVAESQGLSRHHRTARQLRDESTPEVIHATLVGLERLSITDNEYEQLFVN